MLRLQVVYKLPHSHKFTLSENSTPLETPLKMNACAESLSLCIIECESVLSLNRVIYVTLLLLAIWTTLI